MHFIGAFLLLLPVLALWRKEEMETDMENLIISINAVIPFICYLALGYWSRVSGLTDEAFLQRLNKVTFRIFFPFMMFYNIYKSDAQKIPGADVMIFTAVSIVAIAFAAYLIVPRFVKENPRRGVIIQALFRANLLLFGLPLMEAAFGSEAAASASMLVMIVMTVYNFAAVVILEAFNTKEKTSFSKTFVNVVKNPLMIGAFIGLLFFLLKIRLPESLEKPVSALSGMTTPIALFVLGGTLKFSAAKEDMKYIVPTLVFRLILIPMAIIAIAYGTGFRGPELFLMMGIHATPVATSSYPTAQNMGGDGALAGEMVVFSTLISVLTLFLWIFGLKTLGLA